MLPPFSLRSIGGKVSAVYAQNTSEQHIRDINTDVKVKGQTYHGYIFERVKDDGTRGEETTNLARLRRRGKTLKRRASNFIKISPQLPLHLYFQPEASVTQETCQRF
jgi:hypothetical protein